MTTERIEAFYRDATDKDVLRVMNGETVEARFWDGDGNKPCGFYLAGWKSVRMCHWVSSSGTYWQFCQVYDPPQWYVDKPDPGEGYRLLGKFPDEDLQPGDEVWLERKEWVPSYGAATCDAQQADAWYRRRIDQPKPEPKHYTLQVGDTAETPSLLRIAVTEHGIEVQ